MVLQGIALLTGDVARMREFYTAVLCCGYTGDDEHAELLVEGAGFVLYDRAASIRDMAFSYPEGAGSGYANLSIRVKDVDGEYERLKGLGVVFVTAPKVYPWGAYSFHFRDPDGNVVTFVRPPNRP